MARKTAQASIWALVHRQHGVVSRRQLLDLGYSRDAIDHRVRRGRLHRKRWGVYAVGRPDLSRDGELMAAVLAGGPFALVSDHTGAELLGVCARRSGPIEVTVPGCVRRRGLRAHRRVLDPADRGSVRGIPVTSPARTLLDIALSLTVPQLEWAVNMADSLDLIDPETLRADCAHFPRQPGVAKLRRLLDRRTFRATDSRLEQRFLAIVRRTSLPLPATQRYENSFRVDFLWPQLGLVVETDSLRYHRTPAQQYRDARRDQAHFLAGRERLRFTHAQVFFEAEDVRLPLEEAARRLTPLASRA